MINQERSVWIGTPSNITNLTSNIFYALIIIVLLIVSTYMQNFIPLVFVIIPLIFIAWTWAGIKSTVYELTTQRIKLKSGILNKKIEELELYRVKDYKIEQPFFIRLFGLSNITLETSDHSNPIVFFRAIKDGDKIIEHVRNYVESCKKARGVRELDVYSQ